MSYVLVEVTVAVHPHSAPTAEERVQLAQAFVKSAIEGTAQAVGEAPLSIVSVEGVEEVVDVG